jgi:hypothetical protein
MQYRGVANFAAKRPPNDMCMAQLRLRHDLESITPQPPNRIRFLQLKTDKCVYICRTEAGLIILAIHVNDILALADTADLIDLTKKKFKLTFSLKGYGGGTKAT